MELFHRPEDPAVGYWGKRTSAVDWCESNYTWSYYVAEFFNTVTSLPAAFFALYGLFLAYKYGYERRFVVVNLMVGLVGLGSAAFHGTLLYTGQILDELPMIYASLSILYAVLEMDSDKKPVYKYLAHALVAYSVVFTAVYLYLPSFFIFFLLGFIAGILVLIYRCSIIFRNPNTMRHQKAFIVAAIGFYVGGWLFFWIPEVLFCDRIQALNFHAWWHVTSTLGAFMMVLFSVFQRELTRGRKPQLNYNSIMGVPLLPYVHIPEQPEVAKITRKNSSDSDSDPLEISNASSANPSRKTKKRQLMSNFR